MRLQQHLHAIQPCDPSRRRGNPLAQHAEARRRGVNGALHAGCICHGGRLGSDAECPAAHRREADVVPAQCRVQNVLHRQQQHEHGGGIDASKRVVGQAEHSHVDSLRHEVRCHLDLTEPVRGKGKADGTRKRT